MSFFEERQETLGEEKGERFETGLKLRSPEALSHLMLARPQDYCSDVTCHSNIQLFSDVLQICQPFKKVTSS